MASLSDYLAKNYLSNNDTTEKKKKKKKIKKPKNSTTFIYDEDVLPKYNKNDITEDFDDIEKLQELKKEMKEEEMKKRKEEELKRKFTNNSWVTIGGDGEDNEEELNNRLKSINEKNRDDLDRTNNRSRSRSRSISNDRKHRKRDTYSDEESSPRKIIKSEKKKKKENNDNIPTRMSDGSMAGLQAGKDLKLDSLRKKKRQQEILANMNGEESGKYAETVYRNKYGKKIDPALEKAKKAEEQRKKDEEAEKDMEWGKGLVQKRERMELAEKLLKERNKPMAIYSDDEDLNKEQMEKDRWGDPMAKLLAGKSKTSNKKGKGKNKKKAVRPRYQGPLPPPNRFNIEPGYRWDGVDRSNGFEDKYFQMLNKKESLNEVAYKWSTENM